MVDPEEGDDGVSSPPVYNSFLLVKKMPPGADQVGIVAGTDRETSKNYKLQQVITVKMSACLAASLVGRLAQ